MGSWKVFFGLLTKSGQYVPAGFRKAAVVPKRSPHMCTRRAYICIVYVNGDDWKRKGAASVITSPSRTMNLAFVEFCSDGLYGQTVDLPRVRPRTMASEVERGAVARLSESPSCVLFVSKHPAHSARTNDPPQIHKCIRPTSVVLLHVTPAAPPSTIICGVCKFYKIRWCPV